jgi:hypothetical protein
LGATGGVTWSESPTISCAPLNELPNGTAIIAEL